MEFPMQWRALPLEDFDSAVARTQGAAGMELMVQMRPNGRLLDHVRVATGGNEILEAEVRLSDLIPSPNLNNWKARIQFWARDTAIRRNMTTSVWKDVYAMVHSHEIQVVETDGCPVDIEEVVRELDGLPAAAGHSAVIRHAVVIGEDQRMALELQSLPVSLATVNGKPSFRG
jgi:hypothetical protein